MLFISRQKKLENHIIKSISEDEHSVGDILKEHNIGLILRSEKTLEGVKYELIDNAENIYNTVIITNKELQVFE